MTDFDFSRVIVFGGTTEGRLLADKLAETGRLVCVCVATEYGETFLANPDTVMTGRLDMAQMMELFNDKKPSLVIDATHPYAIDVTKNIKEACECTGFPYLRVSRDSEMNDDYPDEDSIYIFNSFDEMIDWLNETEGIIFSTLGVKEADGLTRVRDYKNRVYVRVLPVDSSLQICDEAGFDRSHVIAAMGPFSYERNVEMFKETLAKIMLTKDSGKAGGFAEKIKAAHDCNMKIAVLTRPEETGISCRVEEILDSI